MMSSETGAVPVGKSPKEIFWDKMLEISGHGTSVVGIRAGTLFDEAEKAAFDTIYTELSGIVGINDCFLDFYLSSLEEVVREIMMTGQRDELRDFLAFSHMEAFHRFRAAHLLLARGHYTEAIDLCRGLWETALAIIAVGKGMITVAELFGGVGPRGRQIEEGEGRRIFREVQEVDNRIHAGLLWNSPILSESAKDHIRGMVLIMHSAVHKSRLSLGYNLQTWYDGSKAISLLPEFDTKFAEVSGNLLLFIAWFLTRSFRFFDFLFQTTDELRPWQSKFAKMDPLLADLVRRSPSTIAPAIDEFVRVHLKFPLDQQ